jgi:hypothetical protein
MYIICMSPTLLRFWNLRVVLHTRDHKPAHIHVIGPGTEVKFVLGSWEILSSEGFDRRTLNKIRDYLRPMEKDFLEAWNAFHEIEED